MMSYRLIHRPFQIGGKLHRSGWPYARYWLRQGETRKGILLDDFVDQTSKSKTLPYREPWVAIIHHPPKPILKENYCTNNDMRKMLGSSWFVRSSRHLKAVIALSEHLAGHLRIWLPKHVKVYVIKHPTGDDGRLWTPNHFYKNDRLLLQVGFYFRNSLFMHHIDKPPMFHGKARITMRNNMKWMAGMDHACSKHFGRRVIYNSPVCQIPFQDDTEEYDRLLSSSVVGMELLDASANNAIIECIVRNTPVLVNRHPAAEEYLGKHYPLFFDDLGDIVDMFRDDNQMLHAHEYLRIMNKDDMQGHFFMRAVQEVCRAATH